MPSPFPGMDPFIEMQEWPDFHATNMTVIRELLTPQVRPRYVVRVERRVYLEQPFDELDQAIPDVAILERRGISGSTPGTALLGESTPAIAAVECLLPEAEEHREYFLVLRDRETFRIVTLIELLSPTNKRAGSKGREHYLDKREEILQSRINLVELDLLRGGRRLPMRTELPEGDYYALVRRGWRQRRAAVYAWTLRQKMPPIPIPLQKDEPEPKLDLQAALDLSYDRAAYQDSLDYSQALQPPARPEDTDWLKEMVSANS
ncbi:MAG: DUF4058 family protein [Pirellulaceae bacterium]